MAALLFAIFAFLCAVALLVVLMWPTGKRGRTAKPWQDESHPDIRLYRFQMTEWRDGRRSAPPSPSLVSRAMSAQDAQVRDVIHGL